MIYEPSTQAVIIFGGFVALTLGISFYLGGKAKSSSGYFAAHGQQSADSCQLDTAKRIRWGWRRD